MEKKETKKKNQIKDQMETVLMNFSGIYKGQQFYRNYEERQKEISWVEVQDLPGSNCYCDEEARNRIQKEIKEYTGNGIHFIDSGNYHYVSLLWLSKIQVPFRLLVFDNHTDMQLPAFGGLLSCGGWIAASLEELPMLKEVVLVGPDEDAYAQVEQEFQQKVQFLSRERLSCMTSEEKKTFFENLCEDLPVYISVDKDVLCMEDAGTTWSQGDMKLEELCVFLGIVLKRQRILGLDICGECDPDACEKDSLNDSANRKLLKLWRDMLPEISEKVRQNI